MLNSECHISIKLSPTHGMIHYAQYCLHNPFLVSMHGVTLSHPLKHQCSHLQMPCSMKDSFHPLLMFVYCTCCHHWLSSIVVGCSLLESTIVPHQSALYGYHATKAVVLEWCSVLLYSGSHFWLGGWVVCCHWGWQYHWCGQWWLWWKKCYVQTQR